MTHPPRCATVLVVEGDEQAAAVATCLTPDVLTLPIPSVRAWLADHTHMPIDHIDGKPVVVAFAMNVAADPRAHDAAAAFTEALRAEGATKVTYLNVPGGSRLDVVLYERAETRRSTYLSNLIEQAKPKLPRKPRSARFDPARDPDDDSPDRFFDRTGLLVKQLYAAIVERHPAALTTERKIALYRNGVYHIDGAAFSAAVSEILGDRFRPAHRCAVEEYAMGTLLNAGILLPDRQETPLLNVLNGMLDLPTGTLKPHDPVYLSSSQLPVEWDPDAKCPVYEAWVAETVGDQIDDLEEVAATMLDPSRTPSKAIFLFGPSRSGKSTFLRLMQAICGVEQLSAVTLHQLAENRFAAANVYGKILNCAADLSAAHIEDMSIFKMMTGEDPIHGDRKFGKQFYFTNRALFAFSANELPTVSESSRAYIERIKPFHFPHSFAGSEDPSIETAMMAELPGILVRWVRAWQRMATRGGYLKTDAKVRHEFEVRSDRVRQFVSENCRIHTELPGEINVPAVTHGAEVPHYAATTKRALAQAFNRWAEENRGSKLGERKIIDRLCSINGVVEVRRMPGAIRALNITLRTDADDSWSDGDAPATWGADDRPAVPAVSNPLSGTLNTHAIKPPHTRDLKVGNGAEESAFFDYAHSGFETAGTAGTTDGVDLSVPTAGPYSDLWDAPLEEPSEVA